MIYLSVSFVKALVEETRKRNQKQALAYGSSVTDAAAADAEKDLTDDCG